MGSKSIFWPKKVLHRLDVDCGPISKGYATIESEIQGGGGGGGSSRP